MARERMHIQHVRSIVSGVAPQPSDLKYGEIAVNLADETIYIKKDDETVTNLFQKYNCKDMDGGKTIYGMGEFVYDETLQPHTEYVNFQVNNKNISIPII